FNNTVYVLRENEAGLKGKISNLFYRVYFRYRSFDYHQGYIQDTLRFREQLYGGEARYHLSDWSYLSLEAEKMLGPDLNIKVQARSRYFSAGVQRMFYSPSLFQTYFAGNQLQW